MPVLCSCSSTCKQRSSCGGAKPHDRCTECGKCTLNKKATCEEIIPLDSNNIT